MAGAKSNSKSEISVDGRRAALGPRGTAAEADGRKTVVAAHSRVLIPRFVFLVQTPPLSFAEAKRVLDESSWNMEAAMRRAAGRGGGGGGGAARRQRSCWDNWVFGLAWRVLRNSSLFLRSFLPSVPRAVTPVEAHRAFLLSYEAEYGGFHPVFMEGVLLDALVKGKREGKFVLVYLHSSEHGDTEALCRATLASEAVVEFVDRNFVMWAADVATASGQQAAVSLAANSYPFLAVLYLGSESARGQEVRALGTWVGPLTVDELLVRLMGVLEENDAVLVADRAEMEELHRNRSLLRQQDEDYEESLRADQRKRQQEPAPPAAAPAVTAQRTHSEPKDKEEDDTPPPPKKKLELPEEPAAGESGVVRVAFRLPHQRTERRFRGSETLPIVFAFVDTKLESQQPYKLVSAYPRAVYRRSDDRSLQEAGIGNAATLIYEEDDE